MTKNEFITERTRIISEMLDNPNKYGIYPTTKCFGELDALYDKLQIKVDILDEDIEKWAEEVEIETEDEYTGLQYLILGAKAMRDGKIKKG